MPLLEIKGLSKDFGGLKAVSNFEIQLNAGEIVGLIGPNGAGKTTVFNLITGLIPPDTGSIKFEDKELVGMSPCQVAATGIARTFQNIRLFKNMTAFDNVRAVFHSKIAYGLIGASLRSRNFCDTEDLIHQKTNEILRRLKLADRKDQLAGNLPYGSQRRLEIARALALNPKVILLDEPAAGMNPNEVAGLVELVQYVKDEFGLTILIIEHQMGLIMNVCHKITVMDFGQVIASGQPLEVRNNPLVLQAYLGKEAGLP